MQKLRKTIAILLCLCLLMGTAAIGASAYTDEGQIKQRLLNNTEELYMLGEQKFPSMGNEGVPIYTGETLGELNVQLENAWKYMNISSGIIWELCPVEELQDVYDKLEAAYDGLKVSASSLQELYDAVKGEEDGTEGYLYRYYPERMWREFCAARQTAADVLLAPDDDSVTGAYFALRAAYNKLCASNQVAGDIDGNGYVKVADVLYLQKYLAKVVKMNSSQLFVAAVSPFTLGTITTEDVLIIQKYLAGQVEELKSFDLSRLNLFDRNDLIDEGKII